MSSPVEKYELILAADPRSRIFVELGRALIEQGDHERAVAVLRGGLSHHTDSAMARVLLGRALLSLGRPGEALEPLTQAQLLSPTDARVRQLFEQAREQAAAHAIPPLPPELEPGAEAGAEVPVEVTVPVPEVPVPDIASSVPDMALVSPEAPATTGKTLVPDIGGSAPSASSAAVQAAVPDIDAEAAGGHPRRPPPRLERQPAEVAPPPPLRRPPPVPPPRLPADEPAALRNLPRPERAEAQNPARMGTIPGLPFDPQEAARIAASYERELREKMAAAEPPPERTHRSGTLVVVLLALAVASAVTFLLVRRSFRADEAGAAVAAARAGLARDTAGSLREAGKALDDALALDPKLAEAISLQAQVAALLWTDFADDKALDRARALSASPAAGEGALVARYLTAPGAAERGQAAEALLGASAGAGPLLRILAAGVLRGRGDRDGARHHLEAAAQAMPPMLRALADLGDMMRGAGDADEALRFYRIALQAHATHPRSVLGAAEVRLGQGKDLELSLQEIQALEADPASRPAGPDQLRMLLLRSRLLFALGRSDAAAAALGEAGGRFPGRPEVAAQLAEVEMARGAYDRAEAAAERAVATAPGDPALRELRARARLGRGRFRELLRETEETPSRALRLLRAQARVEQGEWQRARADLEAMRRDGRVPAEAAAWLALCDLATGRKAQAAGILQTLASARGQLPVAQVAQGKLLAGEGKAEAAERELRAAAAADGAPLLARIELAAFLSERKRPGEAAEVLDAAVARNPFHAGARLARARLKLAAGDREAAGADARRVLEDQPGDAAALSVLAEAEGRPAAPPPARKKAAKKKPSRRR